MKKTCQTCKGFVARTGACIPLSTLHGMPLVNCNPSLRYCGEAGKVQLYSPKYVDIRLFKAVVNGYIEDLGSEFPGCKRLEKLNRIMERTGT